MIQLTEGTNETLLPMPHEKSSIFTSSGPETWAQSLSGSYRIESGQDMEKHFKHRSS